MCFPAEQPAQPVRRNTLDQETVRKLEQSLSRRPPVEELVERHILPDYIGPGAVAPALMAMKEKLEKSRLKVRRDRCVIEETLCRRFSARTS